MLYRHKMKKAINSIYNTLYYNTEGSEVSVSEYKSMMPVHIHTHLYRNWLLQVVALDNLLFLVMVDNVINAARERAKQ